MRYLFPVTAINRDGTTRVLNNATEVLSFINGLPRKHRWDAPLVGKQWIDYKLRWGFIRSETDEIQNDWILRDERGRPVDYHEFIPERENYKNRRGKHTYRQGSVFGVGHCSGGWKADAPRKRHGGRGVLARAEMHRREFLQEYCDQRVGRHVYFD